MFDFTCDNYLLKMRYDTRHFMEIPMIRNNFNVNTTGADPFLA